MSIAVYHTSQLPWDSCKQENGKFTRITFIILVITLCFASYIGLVELPEIPRAQKETLPPQLARIIQAQTPPTPPAQIEPEPEPEPVPEPEVIEEAKIEPVQEPLPEPKKIVPKPEPKPKPEPEKPPEITQEEKINSARETAKSKGVLAFSDTLASMRSRPQLQNMANTQQTQGGGQSQVTQRNRIAAPSLAASGGIKSGNISSDIGAAGELAGRRSTEFIAASEGEVALATQRVEEQSQVVGSRDLDKIRQTLDANKGAVYSLYRRALRQDPSIEGKLTLKLVIEPDGSLSKVILLDSELDSEDLVAKLIRRIRLINFGAVNVTTTQLEYAYNFLPY